MAKAGTVNKGLGLALELYIPIEIVHPGFVQMVWREPTTHFLEIIIARSVRLALGMHAAVFRQSPPFFKIAGRTGRDDIIPRGPSAF